MHKWLKILKVFFTEQKNKKLENYVHYLNENKFEKKKIYISSLFFSFY